MDSYKQKKLAAGAPAEPVYLRSEDDCMEPLVPGQHGGYRVHVKNLPSCITQRAIMDFLRVDIRGRPDGVELVPDIFTHEISIRMAPSAEYMSLDTAFRSAWITCRTPEWANCIFETVFSGPSHIQSLSNRGWSVLSFSLTRRGQFRAQMTISLLTFEVNKALFWTL